jgi:hypothetical protein
MTKPAAIQGEFANYKPVMGRKVLQLVIEIPVEQALEALQALGTPTGGTSIPVAIARLDIEKAVHEPSKAQEKPKRSWAQMPPSQQAGVLCLDEQFQRFLKGWSRGVDIFTINGTEDPIDGSADAAEVVRLACGVSSRADLDKNGEAEKIWHGLVADYRAWQRFGEMA